MENHIYVYARQQHGIKLLRHMGWEYLPKSGYMHISTTFAIVDLNGGCRAGEVTL